MSIWYQVKLLIEHASGISMDALHVLVGVGLQLAFAVLFRTPIKGWRPWLFVLALLLLNEASDLWVEQWPQPGMQYGEGVKDVGLTMILPTLLMILARLYPNIFNGGANHARSGKADN